MSPQKQTALIERTRAGVTACDARKGLMLLDHDTLCVADLHFEKASFLQMNGHAPLPTYDTRDSLHRLAGLVADYAPKTVVALGDSFHDIDADQRFSETDCDLLNAIVDSVETFIWVLGNHDPDIPDCVRGPREDHAQVGGFLLTHHPHDPGPDGVNLCGHYHPKLRVNTGRGKVSGPCFAVSEERIILPSFGTFTGGLDVEDIAFKSALPGAHRYHMVRKDRIYRFDGAVI
ncbi:ligase-associated DNA damage response endonuclease PdeM [Litorimonas sp. WD9-15]|uniref:ligase-associated DNA damage response endonuclease PdeM n=1 Tax=Litorimonas sp. WD9-15 TaxID=3418716 RepID=UPI003CFF1408